MWNGMCTIEMIENLKIENSTKMWVCAISQYERRYLYTKSSLLDNPELSQQASDKLKHMTEIISQFCNEKRRILFKKKKYVRAYRLFNETLFYK